jgi:hypothetical protein
MSVPRRFTFQSIADLPSDEQVLSHLDRQHHVVLQLPASYETQKPSLIHDLKTRLPEFCSIFDSGGNGDLTWVTIKEVVSRPALQAIEGDLIHAARIFRHTAHTLANKLAEFYRVPAAELWDHLAQLKPFPGAWNMSHHGGHQCFENTRTGQIVEVSLWFGDEFGVLDPQFFSTFLRTTPELDCPAEIADHYHDTARALDYLYDRGLLEAIVGIFNSTGVFAPYNQRGEQGAASDGP